MELSVHQLQGLIEIFTELKTGKILKKSVKKVSEILNAKGCSIFLFDEGSNLIRLAETTSKPTPEKENITYEEGEGLTGWVFKHRKKIIIKDLDKQNSSGLKEKFGPDINWKSKFVEGKTSKAKSFIAVPIISKNNKFYGVLRSSSTYNNFTNEDLEMLSNIAGYIGIALENGTLFLQEHKKADYFKLLTEFGTRLHSYYNLEDLINFVAKQAAKTFSSETCEIYLRDKHNTNLLVLRAGYGIPKELIDKATHYIGEGLTGTLVKENRTIRLKNVLNYPKYKGKYRKKMVKDLKYGDRLAFLGIPIVVKTDVVGCIKLYNKIPKYKGGPTYFSEDDEKYLDILGYMLSIAMENLQYLDSMKTSAMQMVKTQRLTALGTMAIRLPNEMTNSLTTAQLTLKNLLRKENKKPKDEIDQNLIKKLETIDSNLEEAASGVKTLHDFSTKAGFLKIKKQWQKIIDEALLYLSDEIMHKKIKIIRDKPKEKLVPDVRVEPNEMIEIIINLVLVSFSKLKHYKSNLFINTRYISENKIIETEFHAIDNKKEFKFERKLIPQIGNEDFITPQEFMLSVSKEIISNNYEGDIKVNTQNDSVRIRLKLPVT